MSGSLFREWKVAMAFVSGIAVLAGAFVSEGGEHQYFDRFKPRGAAAPDAAEVPVAVAAPPPAPARSAVDAFGSDADLEAAFAEPEEAGLKLAPTQDAAAPPALPDLPDQDQAPAAAGQDAAAANPPQP